MKKIYVIASFLAVALLFSAINVKKIQGRCGIEKSSGPTSCYAGEPPNNETCASAAGCHNDGTANTGAAHLQLSLSNTDSNYTPGQTYTVTVALSRVGLVRGGFQIIALQDNDITTSPGIFTITDSVRMYMLNAANPHPGNCPTANKTWIQHNANGIDQVVNDTIRWQFEWTAPSSNVGSITFYVASLDANADFDNTNDSTYNISKTFTTTVTTASTIAELPNFSFYPNPVQEVIHLNLPLGKNYQHQDKIYITNILGETVLQSNIQTDISVGHLPKGVYMLHLREQNHERIWTFIKE